MFEIIPAIDLIDGKCVRLSQGDFSQVTIYNGDPVDVALRFEDAGLRRLHVVDLDGAKTGKMQNLSILEKIARKTSLRIDFGGGLKHKDDLIAVYEAGAEIATIGSMAVKEPDAFSRLLNFYDGKRILLGADVRDGRIAINGWQTDTTNRVVPFISRWLEEGIEKVFVTDIATDGVLQGPSLDLYEYILQALPGVKLIASGGVSNIADVDQLERIGCHGVIIGKAIYEGRVTLAELTSRKSAAARR